MDHIIWSIYHQSKGSASLKLLVEHYLSENKARLGNIKWHYISKKAKNKTNTTLFQRICIGVSVFPGFVCDDEKTADHSI